MKDGGFMIVEKYRKTSRMARSVWNGKEDNVIAYEIANEWGADEELFEHLYIDLETYYNENVLKVKKDSILDKIDFFNTQTVN